MNPNVSFIDGCEVFQCLLVLALQEEFLSLLENSSQFRYIVSALKNLWLLEPINDLRNDIT